MNIHERALTQFDRIYAAVRHERKQCNEDRRFYSIAGAQWEGSLAEQFENKPRFEVNKVHLSVIRIINEYRNNRIDASFVSRKPGDNDDLAETCADLYRSCESESTAEEAYDNAFEEAVGGGMGAWQLCAEYEDDEDDDNERQEIRIKPIYDADNTLFFDLDAKRQDKADAKYAYLLVPYTMDAFESEFGESPSTWPKDNTDRAFDWVVDDSVWVAEYYEIERQNVTVRIYQTLDGKEERYTKEDFYNDPALAKTLAAIGTKKVRDKKTTKRRVHKYILSGGGVLEDCGYIAGKHIPLVPCYGKRWVVNNIERCMGHVRLSKDAQRLKNMQVSKLAEISALSSVEKPILTPEQIAGNEATWANDNIRNYPYLLINPITDASGQELAAPPVGYTRAPNLPQPLAALLQLTDTDMQDMLGKAEAGEAIASNISGRAVELVQQRLDMQSYIYISNFAKAIKRSAEIWLSMAREIYVESGREIRIKSQTGDGGFAEINMPVLNNKTGALEYENDLSKADFDIDVVVGPTSQSKRQSTVRAITGMMQLTQDPQDLKVLTSFAIMNIEGEGMADLRDYYRGQLLKMGVVKPTEQEAQELAQAAQNQQPDANSMYLQAAAQEAQAKAVKAHADTTLALAKAEQTQADTASALAEMNRNERQHVVDIAQQLQAGTGQPQPMPENGASNGN